VGELICQSGGLAEKHALVGQWAPWAQGRGRRGGEARGFGTEVPQPR